MKEQKVSRMMVWWQAFRYHFVPPSIFPATLGGLVSWAVNNTFYPWYFVLVLVGIIINHIGLNMTDDYFDYKHSVDHLRPGEKNPYTGGSGTLSSDLIKPRSMFEAFTLCYVVTVSIGMYLTLTRGLPILYFGLVGVFCSVFYTAPPISFSHHGLGELGLLINFGTTIGLGAYFVQAQTITLEAFFATLPMGIMLFSMIVLNEIPDYEEDRRAGKYTLVARYGRRAGVRIFILSWIMTYSVIISAVLFRIMPAITLVGLVSLPITYRTIKTLRNHYDDPLQLAPANLNMIRAHGLTCLALIGAYATQGVMNGSEPLQLLLALTLLAISYAPVAATLLKPTKTDNNAIRSPSDP
jgi:1,4-dihydroxy-2-naphthoate octaprenyltransferase